MRLAFDLEDALIRTAAGIVLTAVVSLASLGAAQTPAATRRAGDSDDVAAIREVVQRYVAAVNDGDEKAFRDLWADPAHVSYVNPMQRLRTWAELEAFFGFLKKVYTRRDLKISNVTVERSGDVAWVVLDWEFTGAHADGKTSQTRGWETQILRKADKGWQLTHVHYSVPSTPPPGGALIVQ